MQNLFNLDNHKKILLLSIVSFFVLYIIISLQTTSQSKKSDLVSTATADTYIPPGHVLVPIQIDNNSSIDGLIGEFALIDLYARSIENSTELVASQVKLIRAPLNRNQFAVLVTETQARKIMQITSAFWVVLQNKNHVSANLEKNLLSKNIESKSTENASVETKVSKKKIRSSRSKIAIEYFENKRL